MREIILHGDLAERFGKVHALEVSSAMEAVKALSILKPGFREAILEGEFRIIRGDFDRGLELPEDALIMRLGASQLHIVPEVSGAGRGAGKAILGVAIIGAAFIGAPAVVGALGPTQGLGATAFTAFGSTVTWGNIATFGLSMALSGVAGMLSPMPKAKDLVASSAEERPSFLFNGAVNNIEQGGIVPVVYGEIEVGSTVLSGGLRAEQI